MVVSGGGDGSVFEDDNRVVDETHSCEETGAGCLTHGCMAA